MSAINYLFNAFIALGLINKIMVIIMIFLLTFTVTVTILDYTSNGKHINKKEW